jgi:hypothetical protein
MDFLSLVFISVAIGMFRATVFPGRDDIQPAYCDIWDERVGTACSIRLGSGFYFYCAVLALTTTNFVVEFCVVERDHVFGARSAWYAAFRQLQQRFNSNHKHTNSGHTTKQCASTEDHFQVELDELPAATQDTSS